MEVNLSNEIRNNIMNIAFYSSNTNIKLLLTNKI